MLEKFDLSEAREANRSALKTVIMVTFGLADHHSPEAAEAVWKSIFEGLNGGAFALLEVERLRGVIHALRDAHCPQASSDPKHPEPLCVGCSVEGNRIAWPCATWRLIEDR